MSPRKSILSLVLLSLLLIAPMQARAGIPVIDAAAVMNLIQQILYWQKQIQGMTNQINQLQQTYNSMTGDRGMQSLLPMTSAKRNYLPQDYSELMNAVNGASATYAGLSSQVQSIMSANAVLTNSQVGSLSPQLQQIVEAGRRSAAMIQGSSQSAYQNTSQRFAALQQLITMVGIARDTKAIQDLQGRIQAEQAMLTNEQTKLQTLYQVAQAEQWSQQQRIRERASADVGSVNTLTPVTY
jgi:type IV secretion system protein VirB5